MSKFFEYRQNNSGGSFAYDGERGISTWVIVEAHDAAEADRRAESIGLYWDGCDAGRDCPCCGDRWSPNDASWRSEEGSDVPSCYGTPIGKFKGMNWMQPPNHEGFVHYLDGRVEGFTPKDRYAEEVEA